MCLAISFGMVYADSTAAEVVNATRFNNTTNESISVPENATNATISETPSENRTNPFAKTKGWKDSTTRNGSGIKN